MPFCIVHQVKEPPNTEMTILLSAKMPNGYNLRKWSLMLKDLAETISSKPTRIVNIVFLKGIWCQDNPIFYLSIIKIILEHRLSKCKEHLGNTSWRLDENLDSWSNAHKNLINGVNGPVFNFDSFHRFWESLWKIYSAGL